MSSHFLGIDYGIRRVAWALLNPDQPDFRLDVGEFVLPGPTKKFRPCDMCQMNAMVQYFHAEVVCCIDHDTLVAIERPITGGSGNARDAARMGMVAGALLSACQTKSVKHTLLAPGSWKKLALGNGNATKDEVMAAMREQYPFTEITSQDVADSMAIATAASMLDSTDQECL